MAVMSATYLTVDGELLMETRSGEDTFYVSDPLGNLIQCRDSSGNKTYEAWYWPYGGLRTSSGSNPSPWGYVGTLGYYTDDSSHIYVRARTYRPDLGRWQTVDPLSEVQGSYTYALANPISYNDAFGTQVMGGHAGPCKVMVCSVYGFEGTPIIGGIPSHKFLCVQGPYGGCQGGLYPGPGAIDGQGGGQIEQDNLYPCGGRSAGGTLVACEVVSNNCDLATRACACLRGSFKDPPQYHFPIQTCYQFPWMAIDCACRAMPTPELLLACINPTLAIA